MCESYARSLLRVSVAQICQALGWDAVQLTACDLLSDVLHRYIQQLARGCHRYSELYGRTDPVLDDVGQAFRLLGVSLSELEDYVHNLEPVPFAQQNPLFPVSKNNLLQFPQPGVLDAEERKDYIPDYMPPLVSLQEEEEEEEALPDMGTSAEAMQVPLDDEDDDMEDDEAVNDENHPVKRHLDSPDAAMGMMPTSKRPRMHPGFSPEWGAEPREPLTSLNPQRIPSGMVSSIDGCMSPETPSGGCSSFRAQSVLPRHSEHKSHATPGRKPKVSSPGRPRTKSSKGVIAGPIGGSPIHSPKSSQKEKKKSPGRTKSPRSPKSPKMGSAKVPHPAGKSDTVQRLPLLALSERMGKENINMRHSMDDLSMPLFRKLEPDDSAIDDSIDAVIAMACAEREPDPFAYTSGSESDSDSFSSPRRLTIMEPSTPKLQHGANTFGKDTSTPLKVSVGPGNWTMDDSINEVIRKVNQIGPSGLPQNQGHMSSGSASPPTPEPLLKVFEEKNRLVSSVDIKKKLKKELKTKLKKKEKDKPKEKDKGRDKGKTKEKNKDKKTEKSKDKEGKMPWKDFGCKEDELREHFRQRDFGGSEGTTKVKSRDGEGSWKEKDKHKDRKKDKEKSKKDKDKRDKPKDRGKDDRHKLSGMTVFGLGDGGPSLFSPSSCLRIPSILPPLPPLLQDKEIKSKEKDKKKDKKEKKKKKDKEREKAKEKEKEKEEKKKEKEREKEKKEREKEKEKEKIRLEKVKMDTPQLVPSPVIPRLTLRVGAGQDKIVISKVVLTSETPSSKSPTPKISASKSVPVNRPRTPPPLLSPIVPLLAPSVSPIAPGVVPLPVLSPLSLLSTAGPLKTPVRSVVTETVSTYVIRDEWGNQIWICPGCNKPDDGSPMIGCDDCDDWYHWPCVGILTAPPEDQQWFCVKCAGKKKDKKHKKRKHKVL